MANSVLVVIVNFKGWQDTIECLESLFKSTVSGFSVCVVDNSEDSESIDSLLKWASGSRSEVGTAYPHLVLPLIPKPVSVQILTDKELASAVFPGLILIRTRNNGFAAANNIGMRVADMFRFKYLWLLNNDTVVQSDALERLIVCARKNPDVGIFGSKLMLYSNPSKLQGVGGRYSPWIGKVWEVGSGELDHGQWDSAYPNIDYVIGASMFVSQAFVADVGQMEEDYFLYYEEIDWCVRGKHKGWHIGFCPDSKVYHKGAASINRNVDRGNSRISDFYAVRNRVLLARKFFPITLLTLYPSFAMFIFNRLRLGQFERIIMLLRILIFPHKHIHE